MELIDYKVIWYNLCMTEIRNKMCCLFLITKKIILCHQLSRALVEYSVNQYSVNMIESYFVSWKNLIEI